MATIDLNLVRTCVLVHETGGFTPAAQKLGVPRSTVSRAVASLEEALDVALFQRTTRTVKTTAAGSALFDRVKPALAALEASLSDVPSRADAPSGTLRITTTADLATHLLAPVVARFALRYPEVNVELSAAIEVVDLVREGFDLALRITRRPLRDSGLIASKLGELQLGLYASPAYLARRGVPKTRDELRVHDWVGLRALTPVFAASRAQRALKVRQRVICNEMFAVRALLRSSAGIGTLPPFLVDEDLAAGRLVRVLPNWREQTGYVYLVTPGRKHTPSRVTVFREMLIETLKARPFTMR